MRTHTHTVWKAVKITIKDRFGKQTHCNVNINNQNIRLPPIKPNSIISHEYYLKTGISSLLCSWNRSKHKIRDEWYHSFGVKQKAQEWHTWFLLGIVAFSSVSCSQMLPMLWFFADRLILINPICLSFRYFTKLILIAMRCFSLTSSSLAVCLALFNQLYWKRKPSLH